MQPPTCTFGVSLNDLPEWHHGIRHYAVWCLPVDDPDWLAFIQATQTLLSPWLHAGYQRQPHITLFAAGLVDKKHYSAAMRVAHIKSLELYSLSPVLLTASDLSTFATAPWIGIEDGDNQLQSLRNRLAHAAAEDSPPPRYQPHVTLGFYRDSYPVAAILQRLEPLQAQAQALPPLRINRLQLCYYDTHQVQGRLDVKETMDLNQAATKPRRRGRPPKDSTRPYAETRQALIQSGLAILTEKGYSSVGIDEILRSADVPKGSFYHYFKSKEAFGQALVAAYAEYFARKLDRFLLNTDYPPLQRLQHFIDDAGQSMARLQFRRGCMIGNLGQEMSLLPESFRTQLSEVFIDWQNRTAACLREAQSCGELSTTQDCDQLAQWFWIGWEGAVLRAKLEQSEAPLKQFSSGFFQLLQANQVT